MNEPVRRLPGRPDVLIQGFVSIASQYGYKGEKEVASDSDAKKGITVNYGNWKYQLL